jgi:hypothetical protein
MKSKSNLAVLAFSAVFLQASLASAYVPPSQFIVKSMVAKRTGMKALKIRGLVNALGVDPQNAVHFRETTVVNPTADWIRSWATSDSDQVLYTTERKLSDSPFPDVLLFQSKAHSVAQALREHSIPVRSDEELYSISDEEKRRDFEVESLTRWKGGIDYLIGLRSLSAIKTGAEPRLYVEKDSFLPVRVVFPAPGLELGAADLRFENFRLYHEFPFPRLITLVKADRKSDFPASQTQGVADISLVPNHSAKETKAVEVGLLQEEMLEVIQNPDPNFQTAPVPPVAGGFTDAGNAAPASLRELVRRYYEIIR